ncbi:hypothetical protein ACIU1J_10355 [Azospirillum doebereinerae]|nr:hypothetical protein [Azospirillum doebereinerae]MCG5243017.1 hypothetical protein [Azospirillum doebereinerae]
MQVDTRLQPWPTVNPAERERAAGWLGLMLKTERDALAEEHTLTVIGHG